MNIIVRMFNGDIHYYATETKDHEEARRLVLSQVIGARTILVRIK